MPKYKKVNTRRPTIVRADVSYYSKGIRRQLRIAYPADAERILAESGDWQVLYGDERVRLKVCHAKKETNWNMEGEAMFWLFFRDGRKIRLYADDLKRIRASKINGALRAYLFPNGNYRQRYIKRARSTKR